MNTDITSARVVLNDGTTIPVVGLGCYMGFVGGGERVFATLCQKALKVGYRHFDTAARYGNEEQVGAAIRASNIPRDQIYLTTKLAIYHRNIREAFEESLRKLGCDYADLYLHHWPQRARTEERAEAFRLDEHPNFIDAWKEIEKLLETGKVKTIGVSNFSVKTLTQLLPHCTVIPASNQVEMHPCLPQNELKAFCDAKGIVLNAYSPLGRSTAFFNEPTVKDVAEKLWIWPAQVVLSWAVQRGTILVPKSEDEGRMSENLAVVKLSEDDMRAVDGIHAKPGMHKSLLTYHKPNGAVFGWTYAELGWNMTAGGIVPLA